MTTIDEGAGHPAQQKPARQKRADAQRNEQALLAAAAAAVFVTSGVDAPVRDIAAAAGVGMGTIYRHFPTRADLVVAVYRHQVEACAEAGPVMLTNGKLAIYCTRSSGSTSSLISWSRSMDSPRSCDPIASGFAALHAYFLDRLVTRLCSVARGLLPKTGEISADIDAHELMRAIGNLCIGADNDPRYDARRMVKLLIAGLLQSRST